MAAVLRGLLEHDTEERVNLVYPARVNIPQGWDKGLVPGVAVDVRLETPAR